MNFPSSAVAEILSHGLIRIRERAAFGDHLACEFEADHLHNLPVALEKQSIKLLRFYYETERVDYLARLRANAPDVFVRPWQTIAEYLSANAHS